MLASIRRNGLRLALFALVCTSLVAFTHDVTRERIARQAEQQLQQQLHAMLPAGSYDNRLASSCVQLNSAQFLGDTQPHPVYLARYGDRLTGYIVQSVAPDGYGGAIRLLTGVSAEGQIQRVEVLSHQETPGLGDKIERTKSDWLDEFKGERLEGSRDPRWAVSKDGGMFDGFTGATITPRAVIKGVKQVLLLLEEHPEWITQAPACEETP